MLICRSARSPVVSGRWRAARSSRPSTAPAPVAARAKRSSLKNHFLPMGTPRSSCTITTRLWPYRRPAGRRRRQFHLHPGLEHVGRGQQRRTSPTAGRCSPRRGGYHPAVDPGVRRYRWNLRRPSDGAIRRIMRRALPPRCRAGPPRKPRSRRRRAHVRTTIFPRGQQEIEGDITGMATVRPAPVDTRASINPRARSVD